MAMLSDTLRRIIAAGVDYALAENGAIGLTFSTARKVLEHAAKQPTR